MINTPKNTPDQQPLDLKKYQNIIDTYSQNANVDIIINNNMNGLARTNTSELKRPSMEINLEMMMKQFNLTADEVLFIVFHEIEHLLEEAALKNSSKGKAIKQQQEEKFKQRDKHARAYHKLENVIRDAFVNNEVISVRKAPALYGTRQELFREKTHKDSDLRSFPKHLQLIHAINKECVLPNDKCIVDADVRKIIDSLMKKGFLTGKALIDDAINGKHLKGGKFDPNLGGRLSYLREKIEPIYKKLFEEDMKKAQEQREGQNNKQNEQKNQQEQDQQQSKEQQKQKEIDDLMEKLKDEHQKKKQQQKQKKKEQDQKDEQEDRQEEQEEENDNKDENEQEKDKKSKNKDKQDESEKTENNDKDEKKDEKKEENKDGKKEKEEKENKDGKENKESKDGKESKESKEENENEENKENKENKDGKESKEEEENENEENKEDKESKDGKESKEEENENEENKENKESKDGKESKENEENEENKENKESKDGKESKENEENEENEENKENKESKDGKESKENEENEENENEENKEGEEKNRKEKNKNGQKRKQENDQESDQENKQKSKQESKQESQDNESGKSDNHQPRDLDRSKENPFEPFYERKDDQLQEILKNSLNQEQIEELVDKITEETKKSEEEEQKTEDDIQIENRLEKIGITQENPDFNKAKQLLRHYDNYVDHLEQMRDADSGKNAIEMIMDIFQKIKSNRGKSRVKQIGPVDIEQGVRLHGPKIAEGIADIISGEYNPEMFQKDIKVEYNEKESVGEFDVTVICDGSGSMGGHKNREQKKATLLIFESLKRLHDKIERENTIGAQQKVKFNTDGKIFLGGDTVETLKTPSPDFDDQERLKTFQLLDRCPGDTNDYSAVREVYQDIIDKGPEYLAKIQKGDIKRIVLVITDGGSNDPDILQQHIKALRKLGVLVYGIGVGDEYEAVVVNYNTGGDKNLGYGIPCAIAEKLPSTLLNILKPHLEEL